MYLKEITVACATIIAIFNLWQNGDGTTMQLLFTLYAAVVGFEFGTKTSEKKESPT